MYRGHRQSARSVMSAMLAALNSGKEATRFIGAELALQVRCSAGLTSVPPLPSVAAATVAGVNDSSREGH